MRLAGVIVLSTLLAATAHAQRVIENQRHGYTIEIPDAWNEASDDFLAQFSRMASNANQRLRFVAAYQPASFENGLAYPYVFVQTIPYSDFGLTRQPTADERVQIIEAMTGMDIRTALDQSASEKIRSAVTGVPTIERFQFDDASSRYNYDLRMEVAGIGQVSGRIHGVFGEWSILQTAYYAMASDWADTEPEADAILASFDALEGIPQPEYSDNSVFNRALGGTVVGAVAGALGAAAIAAIVAAALIVYQRTRKPKPPPL